MIENTEKVDTCQLEIQKRWTPVEGTPGARHEEGAIFWVFRFEIPGSRALLLSLSQSGE